MTSFRSSLEYEAAGGAAAVFDLPDRAHVQLTGRDRQPFLHNFCTNDIKRLRSGEGCEAFIANIKGRILGHVLIFCQDDRLLLDSVSGSDSFLMQHLDRYLITEDVALQNRTSELSDLLVAGPAAGRIVSEAFGVDPTELPMNGHRSVPFETGTVTIARAPFTVQPGYLLIGPRSTTGPLGEALRSRGAVTAGRDVFEALRIEACFPLYGVDLSDDMLAQEAARTQQAISFTKGCYLGQEPIARLDSLGHANRMLRGLRLDSGDAPPVGANVYDESGQEAIGTISSAAVSPADGRALALALLRFKYGNPGTSVAVQVDESTKLPATVYWP